MLKFISDKPYSKLYLRQIARELEISSSATKKAIDQLENLNLIRTEKYGNLRIITGNMEEILFKQYKILENISFLKDLVEKLKPTINITLYGSYSKGENDETSDIDLLIITNNKKIKITDYKNTQLQLKLFTPKEWSELKKTNKAYTQEIINGITIYGEPLR